MGKYWNHKMIFKALKKIIPTKILITICIFLAVVLSLVTFDSALAQPVNTNPGQVTPPMVQAVTGSQNPTPQQISSVTQGGNGDPIDKNAPGVFGPVVEWVTEALFSIPLKIASFFLWLAGILLNYAIYFGIEIMGKTINDTPAIRLGWSIIRDFINIFFIFGLLYISIQTIIDGWSDGTRKSLSRIIMAALLINFSFFFTAILIDASNTLTLAFYNKMEGCQIPSSPGGDDGIVNTPPEFDNFVSRGLSVCFMDKLGLQTFYNLKVAPTDPLKSTGTATGETEAPTDVSGKTRTNFSYTNLITALLLAAVFVTITAIVFFAAAITIIFRFIALIFLLVTSPVMFAGWILPKFKEMTDAWIKKASELLISLPVMFLFIYMTYQMMLGTNSFTAGIGNVSGQQSTLYNLVHGNSNMIGVAISFVLILGFMIGSIIVAKKTGMMGADFAMKMGAGVAIGGSAMLGRQTVGRLGNRLANSETMKGWAKNEGKGIGSSLKRGFGKGVVTGGEKVGKSGFDARNTGAAAALKGAGVDMGKGQTGGYAKQVKDQEKAIADRQKRYGVKIDEKGIKSAAGGLAMGSDEYMKHSEELAGIPVDDKSQAAEDRRKDLQKKMTEIEKAEATKLLSENRGYGYRQNLMSKTFLGRRARINAVKKKVDEMYKSDEDKKLEKLAKETAKAQKELEGDGGEKKKSDEPKEEK